MRRCQMSRPRCLRFSRRSHPLQTINWLRVSAVWFRIGLDFRQSQRPYPNRRLVAFHGGRSGPARSDGRVEMWRGDCRSAHRCCRPFRLAVPYEPDLGSVSTPRSSVGSRTGAPALGSGGCHSAFALALSPATIAALPAPATSNGAGGFPALRFPARFASRVMGPMQLETLSTSDCGRGSR